VSRLLRRPSSICVLNDAPVRDHCLDRSILRRPSEVDDLDGVLLIGDRTVRTPSRITTLGRAET
jgi:hypothetical protein